jgi:hypothetical protein
LLWVGFNNSASSASRARDADAPSPGLASAAWLRCGA